MLRIFISHSNTDNAQALALSAWLRREGWGDHFLDVDRLAPGDRWMPALEAAVNTCEAVILLASPASYESKYCFHECAKAKELGKRIISAVVKPVPASVSHIADEWQRCDLTSTEDVEVFSVKISGRPPVEVGFPRAGLDALALGLRKAGLDASRFDWPPQSDPGRSPYPGLRPLDELDAAVFFGREDQIGSALNKIGLHCSRDIERMFLISGASGVGKSSFLRAGLVPRLRRDAERYIVLPTIRCGPTAISGDAGLLKSLTGALRSKGASRSQDDVESELGTNGLVGILQWIDAKRSSTAAGSADSEHVIVIPVDQAEHLLSIGEDETRQFLLHLDALANVSSPRVFLLATVRSDSLSALHNQETVRRLGSADFVLPAMRPWGFKELIEEPARRHSESVRKAPLAIASQLTATLLEDASGPDALPLLAMTLELLVSKYSTEQGANLTANHYEKLGRLRGSIDEAVSLALASPDSEPAIPRHGDGQRELLEKLFPLLATVDLETKHWKRRVALHSALCAVAPQAAAMVSRLVDKRLLRRDVRQKTLDASPSTEGNATVDHIEAMGYVEVAHEALLRQWKAFEIWLSRVASDLAATEAVHRSAVAWRDAGDEEIMLVHTRQRLLAAEALLEDAAMNGRFEQIDQEYLRACRKRESSARLRATFRRVTAATALPLAMVALPVGLSYWWTLKANVLLPPEYVYHHLKWWLAPIWMNAEPIPSTVVVGPGEYVAGCQVKRDDVEGTECSTDDATRATVQRPFAIGTREVTFLEYDYYIWATGYRFRTPRSFPEDGGFGRLDRPVINVSWHDANAYANWLSKRTGQPWRLLTETEWEYAARAGFNTAYPWGKEATKGKANCSRCDDQFGGKKTSPVASFDPNPWGLYDMAGNVAEWVEDKAAEDRTARVLRGGSYKHGFKDVRTAYRSEALPTHRDSIVGFRVCRDLPASSGQDTAESAAIESRP